MKFKETVILHLLFPLLAMYVGPNLFAFWFYVRLTVMFKNVLFSSNRSLETLLFCVVELGYLSSLARMLSVSSIPYEVFTYGTLSASLLFVIRNKKFKLNFGLLLLILIIFIPPLQGELTIKSIVFTSGYIFVFFTLFGAIKSFNVTPRVLEMAENIWIVGGFTITLYALIAMPSLEQIEFKLGANFATTGGFGTNQFSAIVGSAAFLLIGRLNKGMTLFKLRLVDFLVLFIMLRQTLLSFSRGGFVVLIISVLLILLPKIRVARFKSLIAIFIGIFFTFQMTNTLTGGKLLLRYQGETEGTFNGSADKTLGKITSNRSSIFLADYHLFLNHPFFGVGTGSSKYLRKDHRLFSSHTELTRILAEWGFVGFLGFTIFFLGLFPRGHNIIMSNYTKALISVAFLTTFHNAVRTPVPVVFLLLAYIYHQNQIHES